MRLKPRNLGETYRIGMALVRGFVLSRKFDAVGRLFRSSGWRLEISKKYGTITLGDRVGFYSPVKISVVGQLGNPGCVIIGNRTIIGDRTQIHCGSLVQIGNNCFIAWDVNILDRDYHKLNGSEEIKPVVIQDNVWIGARATILKGVTIGNGAVVAAASVVTQDVPPRTLVAGNPAKIIRENITWEA